MVVFRQLDEERWACQTPWSASWKILNEGHKWLVGELKNTGYNIWSDVYLVSNYRNNTNWNMKNLLSHKNVLGSPHTHREQLLLALLGLWFLFYCNTHWAFFLCTHSPVMVNNRKLHLFSTFTVTSFRNIIRQNVTLVHGKHWNKKARSKEYFVGRKREASFRGQW